MDNHQSTSFSTNTVTTAAGTGENLGLGSSSDQATINAGNSVTDLSSGIKITHMNPCLYKAAANGKREFLRENPDQILAEVTPNTNTVLHIAAQFGQADCVKEILKLHSPSSLLRAVNQNGETPLHIAAREGHLDVVLALIEAEALEEELEGGVAAYKDIMRMTNDENDTPLHEAVRYNHLNVVKFLSSQDPEFTYQANDTGETPLYMAAERGFHDLVLVILETCTSPAYNGPNGRTVLHAAVICHHKDMTKRILDWKPALTTEADKFGWTPLHCAAYLGNNPIVRHLLHKSDDSVVYLQIKDGKKTALHLAASRRHLNVVRELILHSPDCCEQVDDRGWNVIHFTVMTKSEEFIHKVMKIHWLKVRGIVNKKDGSGNTPLHLLADSQSAVIFGFLRGSIVDKMAFNKKNLTALDVLSSAEDLFGYKRIITGALINAKARIGPLGWQHRFKIDPYDKQKGRPASELKEIGATRLIVATLIATVTFAAGFTIPGGYNGNESPDKGMAILRKKLAFKAFIVSDTIAFALSASAVCVFFYMAMHAKKDFLLSHLSYGFYLTNIAMLAMTFAFMSGIYAVLAPSSWLAISTCVIVSCCFLISYIFVRMHVWVSWYINDVGTSAKTGYSNIIGSNQRESSINGSNQGEILGEISGHDLDGKSKREIRKPVHLKDYVL